MANVNRFNKKLVECVKNKDKEVAKSYQLQ